MATYDREKSVLQTEGRVDVAGLSVAALMELVTDLGISPHRAIVWAARSELIVGCPNPFCNGYGDLDVSKRKNGAAIALGACEVGPHARR